MGNVFINSPIDFLINFYNKIKLGPFKFIVATVYCTKAELLREGIIFLIHLFAKEILLMKKLNIEETKAT